MKVKINYEELGKLKFNSNNDYFLEGKANLLQQIKLGNHLTCLVSGYRGVGKSTLVKDITEEIISKTSEEVMITEESSIEKSREESEEIITETTVKKDVKKTTKKNNPKLVLFQNIDKYDEYTLFLRKIIRQLYLEISKNELIKNKIIEESSSMFDKIESLYENTYFDKKHIIHDNKSSSSFIAVESDSGNFNVNDFLKEFSPIILPIITSIGVYKKQISGYFNALAIIGSLLYLFLKNWRIKTKISKGYEKKIEIQKQTLYDDEIAEYQLFLIFEELKKMSIDVYIVLDEMDKVDDLSKLKQILSELKHFLLFESISTVVISGQHLLYESYQSNFEDDGMLSNLFSIKLHVPLQNTQEIQNSIRTIFKDNISDPELLELYIKHIIYQSKRVSRNILNSFYNVLVWNNGEAFLDIDESRKEEYKKDSNLLELLETFEKDVVRKVIREDGIIDMILYHLFIWLKKMEQKVKFSDKDIINVTARIDTANIGSDYPIWIEENQKTIFYLFLTYLVDKKIIEESENNNDILEDIIEGSTYYNWINVDNEVKDKNSHWKFLDAFIQLEKITGRICLNYDSRRKSFMGNIKILEENHLLSKDSRNNLESIRKIRNSLAHGMDVSVENLDDEIEKIIMEQDNLVRRFIEKMFKKNGEFELIGESSENIRIKYLSYELILRINRKYDFRQYLTLENFDVERDNKINIIFDYSGESERINAMLRSQAEVIDISTFVEKIIINNLITNINSKLKIKN